MPFAIVISFAVAVTLIVPPPVVVKSPASVCVTPVPPVRLRLPVPDDIALFAVNNPDALNVTEPDPVALIALFTFMAPLSAVTVTVPVLPVVIFASCVMISPVNTMSPLVELVIALMSIVPASAFNVMSPEPCAVTTLFTIRSPASTSILILPLPPVVRTPPPPIIKPLVSCIKISPVVVFVATSVPIVVSISAKPVPPMPVAARSVAVPEVVILGVSAAVSSVIDPVVAEMLTFPLPVVISVNFTFVAAVNATVPLPVVVYIVPSTMVISSAVAVTLMLPPLLVRSPSTV